MVARPCVWGERGSGLRELCNVSVRSGVGGEGEGAWRNAVSWLGGGVGSSSQRLVPNYKQFDLHSNKWQIPVY